MNLAPCTVIVGEWRSTVVIYKTIETHYIVDNDSYEIDTTPCLNCLFSAAEPDKTCEHLNPWQCLSPSLGL